ncbi:aminoglycoside 6'-N-acetyltransferase [Sediminibacterium sp. TEGAF015]|uniref:aminoglycoside 6'-N-acetyltransferase n=1 Tax=Sediminibacterium sp. TEGAF015 TaxID=575378 RepID=UPI00220CA4D4|nr:aminoglycoside 6'-N-acetyltransferase [Sediminibacterium sp. TEGAF015]BDQ12149.1 N-acetyltransferase [Sediminibacterium sp. TEGAF015]
MLIEPINNSNLKELTRLFVEMFPETDYDAEFRIFEKSIGSANEICFLAREGNQYIGFIHITLRSDYVEGSDLSPTAYVEALYVKPDCRRKGIAKALLQKAEQWAISKNCFTLASDTAITNYNSIRFHRCIGFEEANRIVCFIKKLGE